MTKKKKEESTYSIETTAKAVVHTCNSIMSGLVGIADYSV